MAKPTLTQDYVKRLFKYDAVTGILYWRERPASDFAIPKIAKSFNTRMAGKPAASVSATGHLRVRVDGHSYLVHSLIWLYNYGYLPKQLDHINGTPKDNRLANLRMVGQDENNRNAAIRTDNTSGVTGVSPSSSGLPWEATISDRGRRIRLGQYQTIEEAIAARQAAAKVLGYHENHGRAKPTV